MSSQRLPSGVCPEYFATLEAKLLRGRYFSEVEKDSKKARTAIVSEIFAQLYFCDGDPVGENIAYVLSKDSIEITGGVEDIKEGEIDTTNRPITYGPFNQSMWASLNLIVRTSQAEQSVLPAMTASIHQINPEIAISNPATMNKLIGNSHYGPTRNCSFR